VSGDGERVVAEFGQDVAGLPDDLAGLDKAARLLFLRSFTAAWSGAEDRAWVLPALYTA
jgi:hypothetical protein